MTTNTNRITIPANLAERYVGAVEHETERTRLYAELIDAQRTAELARRALAEAEARVRDIEADIDDLEEA